MLITWLSPRTWHILIADDKKHRSLNRPIHHENVEYKLQIRHLLQEWNPLPLQVNDGDFADLVLLIDVDSRLDLLFYFAVGDSKRNQLVHTHHNYNRHGDDDPFAHGLLASLVVFPVSGEIDDGPEEKAEEEEVTTVEFGSTHYYNL